MKDYSRPMEILKPYRARIDAVDDQIIDLLVKRFDIIREVGELKAEKNIPPILPDRVIEVRERCAQRAAQRGIDADLVRRLYDQIITFACEMEQDIASKS